MSGYKFLLPPKDREIVFIRVIKPCHWVNRPGQLLTFLKPGDITWSFATTVKTKYDYELKCDVIDHQYYYSNNLSIIPENNRYFSNFDSSCFELLETFTQRINHQV